MEPGIWFPFVISIVAFLYASVGHGGASGYLALMAIAGYAGSDIRTSALILNIVVAGIAFLFYFRNGHFHFRLLWPFLVLSIPCAFLGAKIPLTGHWYKIALAVCLLLAVFRLMGWPRKGRDVVNPASVHIPLALACGALIGLLSGLIGIGGGILLSPLLLFLGWADLKQAAAVSAAFIFLNSISGLAGSFTSDLNINSGIYPWIAAAVIGGIAGSHSGSRRFNTVTLKYLLGIVLLFACFKLIVT